MSRPVLLLVGVNVLVAGAIAMLVWTDPEPWSPPAAILPDPASFRLATEVPQGFDAALQVAITDRPLFFPSRRPYVADAAPVAADTQGPDPFDDVSLLGLYSDRKGKGGLIIREKAESRRLTLGERVGDWELVALDGLEARFRKGTEEKRLELVHARANGPVPAGAPPAADKAPPLLLNSPPGSRAGTPPTPAAAAVPNDIAEEIKLRRARREATLKAARERLQARRDALERR